MSGLSRTPGKRVYGESRTVGSNPTLSANKKQPTVAVFYWAQGGWTNPPVRPATHKCVSRGTLHLAQGPKHKRGMTVSPHWRFSPIPLNALLATVHTRE